MNGPDACPECGSRLPADAPRGLCPRCLLGAADSANSTAAYQPAPASAPARGPEASGPPATLDEFRRAVLELGLIDPDELDAHAERASGEVPGLARALVRSGKLTSYQAGALAQGKAKGLVIGPYLVLEKRGQGGMGVVFKARERATGKVVALKILLPSFGRDREAVLRFRREYEVAAQLVHPNIVSALDASEDRGVQYLTMEYVEGHDLDDLVREVGPLPIKMSLHCVIQAARGLAAAHARGIIHRDVKPGNLMLDPGGMVRVLDLGLARVIEASNPLARGAGATLTQSGAYMGTVDFIAPEQADDSKRADHQADIYSLACTLYFLLAGRPPFEGETILKRLMAHQQQPAPSLHAVRDDVPSALEAAYQTMMAKRPADRPRSMAEVIELLESCRTTPNEAKEARASLRNFAETVMKRASPRKRGWGVDASVFARPSESRGLRFDPDLKLEDLVMDYREEAKPRSLDEDELPPLLPRIASPRRRSRRLKFRPSIRLMTLGVMAIGAYVFFPKLDRNPVISPRPALKKVAASPEEFRPLFAGNDLKGWAPIDGSLGDWSLKDGVLESTPFEGKPAAFLASERTYSDFSLRLEVQTSAGANGGFMMMSPARAGEARSFAEMLDIGASRTGETWLWADGGSFRKVPVPRLVLKSDGGWNLVEVERRGGLITIKVDGQVVHDHFAGVQGPRSIGFQNYPGKGVVRYRNASIKDLTRSDPWVSLFNGKDLHGWIGAPEDYEVRDGLLSCKPDRRAILSYPYEFADFAARVEFRVAAEGNSGLAIHYPGEGDPAMTGLCEVQILDETAPKHARIDPRGAHGSAFGMAAASRKTLRPSGEWNTMEVTVRGTTVKVESNGVVVLDSDLSKVREFPEGQSHPGQNRASGFFGLFGIPGGRVEFRKIEVKVDEWNETPDSNSPGDPGRDRSSPILFSEDFSGPNEAWTSSKPKDSGKVETTTRWIRDGIYSTELKSAGIIFWVLLDGSYSDFSYETVGRLVGDNPGSRGSMVFQIFPKERSLKIRIDEAGALFVEPGAMVPKEQRTGPWLGPIVHPAITPGGAGFNVVRLVVRKRQLEIFVNSARVCDPLEFDWDLTPARLGLGVESRAPKIRAEYDRLEIRQLDNPAATNSPAIARFQKGGGKLLPKGQISYEGSSLKVAGVTGGAASFQTEMKQRFQGQWANDRQLFWNSPNSGDVLTLDLPVEVAGEFYLGAAFTRAGDYGQIKLALDGKPLYGDKVIDLFDPQVRPSGPQMLGSLPFSPGTKRLTVTVVGKNGASSGYNFGLDEIQLIPVR
ncbi:family 16 glycoside hydrolase [Tundrisphaera lichenicola]|uniref:family 16 glycoside hydrolase n=1 Tax=Tundrisphaera lichenicola TaxID=2029860 RepID=UPI003EB69FD9